MYMWCSLAINFVKLSRNWYVYINIYVNFLVPYNISKLMNNHILYTQL